MALSTTDAFSAGGRGRRRGRGRRGALAEINVTPLVDVMLVLLIIFMVTAPLLVAGVPVELPDSRATALDQQEQQLTISLDPDGGIYVDDVPVDRGALAAALANVPRDGDGKLPLVTLRGDKALDYGRVMQVMGELNRAGFTSISLVTNSTSTAP